MLISSPQKYTHYHIIISYTHSVSSIMIETPQKYSFLKLTTQKQFCKSVIFYQQVDQFDPGWHGVQWAYLKTLPWAYHKTLPWAYLKTLPWAYLKTLPYLTLHDT